MRRTIFLILGLCLGLSACSINRGADEPGGIDVVDVSGPLDASALQFIIDSIELAADQEKDLVVVQINSKAVLDEDAARALDNLITTPPVPVAVWVGPAPAYAYGGAIDFVFSASHGAAAPGTVLGHSKPTILGVSSGETDEERTAEQTDLDLQPTIRQYVLNLDGETFNTAGGPVTVETIKEVEGGIAPKDFTFRKPDLITRFLRLAVTPEAAFFFLTIGLAIAVFEFYALGPGVAAAVATMSLIPGVWGLLTLPANWWAVGLMLVSFLILVTAHQRGGLFTLTIGGAAILQISGMFLIDGGGQIEPRWWLVLLSVLTVLFFFLLAMPTVQRARLSSETVGRENLIGRTGTALVGFDPDGMVEVSGARWRATAHREAGIAQGDLVEVIGVDGLYLEVDPAGPERET